MKNYNLPKKRNKEMKTKSTKPPKFGPSLTTLKQSPEELANAQNLLDKAQTQLKPVRVLPKGMSGDYTKKP